MPEDPDIKDIIAALGGVAQMPVDPITAGLNLGTVALLLVMQIIDTVPPELHAENWERIDRVLDKLRIGDREVRINE